VLPVKSAEPAFLTTIPNYPDRVSPSPPPSLFFLFARVGMRRELARVFFLLFHLFLDEHLASVVFAAGFWERDDFPLLFFLPPSLSFFGQACQIVVPPSYVSLNLWHIEVKCVGAPFLVGENGPPSFLPVSLNENNKPVPSLWASFPLSSRLGKTLLLSLFSLPLSLSLRLFQGILLFSYALALRGISLFFFFFPV